MAYWPPIGSDRAGIEQRKREERAYADELARLGMLARPERVDIRDAARIVDLPEELFQ